MDLIDHSIEFTTCTFCILGYCRSTVGGYDVWSNDPTDPCLWHNLQRNIPNTSINAMNYMAVVDCLDHILDMVEYSHEYTNLEARPHVYIQCGCFMVCQQLNGQMQSNALKLWYIECEKRMHRLNNRAQLTIKYVPDLYLSLTTLPYHLNQTLPTPKSAPDPN